MTTNSQTTHDDILTKLFGKNFFLNHHVSDNKKEFGKNNFKDELRFELIKAQYALRNTRTNGQATGLLVLVNGIELSGKGKAVAQLREWVDPRLLNVEATLGNIPARFEPIWQAHAPKLPRHGNITAYFGNWYADLVVGALAKLNGAEDDDLGWQDYVDAEIKRLDAFEADLSNNHTKILKCWFDIDDATLQARLTDKTPDPTWLYGMDWQDKKAVQAYRKIANYILHQQNNWRRFAGERTHASADFESLQKNMPDSDEQPSLSFIDETETQFALHVLTATHQALEASDCEDSITAEHYNRGKKPIGLGAAFSWADIPDKLTDIDDPDMDKSDYKDKLAEKQKKLARLLRERKNLPEAGHVVFAFEGMDAAGKGGAIKRLVSPLDPREYQIYNIAAPTTIELQHPYLWRFWQRLPEMQPSFKDERLSRVAIFDRTWYGRVLVERIEGFASDKAWQRAYDEINRMEADLHAHGTLVIKYWLAIDKQEQLERFEDREETPHKQFKLTDDDWRNRDKWHEYVQAAADMLARTNTHHAPWHVVATNDKRTARLAVLDHAIKQLERV